MKLNTHQFVSFFSLVLLALLISACAGQYQAEKYDQNIRERARSHTDLGAVYLQQRQYEIALEEFDLAVKIDPNFGAAYNGLGLIYSSLGQDALAEQSFRKAVQIDPNNSESHNNYGNFLCSKNRIDESIKEFVAAVKNPLYATPALAYTNAGICSLRKQDVASAVQYFERALQIEPLMAVPAYQLALIQFNRNEPAQARLTLQKAVLSQPTPENLWLSILIARKLGDVNEESSYVLQLRRQFPQSEQARLLANGQ